MYYRIVDLDGMPLCVIVRKDYCLVDLHYEEEFKNLALRLKWDLCEVFQDEYQPV